jgi:signal transduction histidine kinase
MCRTGYGRTWREGRSLQSVTGGRPVPWVSTVVYAAVLVAGGYAQATGLGAGRPVLFLGALAALFGLDLVEHRRWPARTPVRPAVALLAVRVGLFAAVAAGDGSGLSRVLFVLIPFTAYFAFGRTASIALGTGCLVLLVVGYQLTAPHWYADVARVSDLLMFAVGLALTIVMAAVAVRERSARIDLESSHARLTEYADRVAELSAAAERNRIARDIHDELGHSLTAIAVLLEKAAAFGQRDPQTARQAVDDAHRCARQALREVRHSVRSLHAESHAESAPFLLSAALRELLRGSGTDRPAITLDIAGDETGYPRAALMALYRAAQEGITNARRHADASRVSVTVAFDPTGARLVVADDGRGMPPGREGFGLLGMRERVGRLAGRVDVSGGPGTGTRLVVTLPRSAS